MSVPVSLSCVPSPLPHLARLVNDSPVQYLISFTGTGDDSGNVTAVLTSIVFKSLTPPLFTGSGNGSLTGTLVNRTLVANVTGQFSGELVGTYRKARP